MHEESTCFTAVWASDWVSWAVSQLNTSPHPHIQVLLRCHHILTEHHQWRKRYPVQKWTAKHLTILEQCLVHSMNTLLLLSSHWSKFCHWFTQYLFLQDFYTLHTSFHLFRPVGLSNNLWFFIFTVLLLNWPWYYLLFRYLYSIGMQSTCSE